MRNTVIGIALLAVSATAQAQTSSWQFFQDEAQTNGTVIAFLQASNGTQLVFKCDKPGKRSVYAMVTTDLKLGKPGPIPAQRTTAYRFDGGATMEDEWRYYERHAVALHTSRDNALTKLLAEFGAAKQLELRLDPLEGVEITSTFDIAGAPEALGRVFESCKDDTNPLK